MLIVKRGSLFLKRVSSKPLALHRLSSKQHPYFLNPTRQYSYFQAKQAESLDKGNANKSKAQEAVTSYIEMNELIEAIRKDTQSYFVGYQQIKRSFVHHLQAARFTKQNQAQLVAILYELSKYPSFALENDQLLAIYKIVCFNMHLSTVQSLNKTFLFLLVAEPNISQSPVYHEFIKFYLHVPIEEIKVKYQLDLDNLSVVEAIKQLIVRATQRGFFARTPPYTRNLNLIYLEDVLCRLASRPQTADALMIKKINYTIFMDIKVFYEQEMKQNLYHERKTELMSKFNHEFMQVLSKQIDQIQHESTHLRELYMKLYLTLPDDADLSQSTTRARKEQLYRLRFKNVIYLYRLSRMHISRMDHYKLEQLTQNIGVVIEFVQQVEQNFKHLAEQPNLTNLISCFSIPEIFHILDLLSSMHLNASLLYRQLLKNVNVFWNPYTFTTYFDLAFPMLQKHQNKLQLLPLIQDPNHLSSLNLQQLYTLSSLIVPEELPKFISLLYQNILATILSTDFQVIGGEQLLKFLKIYSKHKIVRHKDGSLSQQGQKNGQMLRIFLMRYLSDHHTQFKIGSFEEIVNQLLQLEAWQIDNFDDQGNNYPRGIWEQIDSYLGKIEMLFGADTLQKLKERRSTEMGRTNLKRS